MKQFIVLCIAFIGVMASGIPAASGEIIGPVQPVEPIVIEAVVIEPPEFEPAETGPLELEPAETQALEIQGLGQEVLVIKDTDEASDEGEENEEEETSWIEIDLKDEEGKPILPKRYRVVFPDGSVKEGDLDEKGIAHLSTLDPGECQISFPGLDSEAWDKEE